MKRKLPVLIAIVLALAIALAACQSQNQSATGGNQTDPLPSHVQQADSLTDLPNTPVNGDQVQTDVSPVAPADPTPADPKLITTDEAIAIALKDAGFNETDIIGLHAEFERDDGIIIYDVDFYKDGKEYDYEIHAETGEILKPVKKTASSGTSSGSSSAGSSSTSSSSSSSTAENITKDEAISKALSHAGLKKDQVSRLRAELDRDDGRTVYEVDFQTTQWEYEYEINAKTGAIIKAEKDWND